MSAYHKEGHQRQTQRERFLSSCPEVVQVSLSEVVAGAQEGLLSLCIATGFAVLRQLMEAEVTEVCGPKGKHDRGRKAVRHSYDRQILGDFPAVQAISGYTPPDAVQIYRRYGW